MQKVNMEILHLQQGEYACKNSTWRFFIFNKVNPIIHFREFFLSIYFFDILCMQKLNFEILHLQQGESNYSFQRFFLAFTFLNYLHAKTQLWDSSSVRWIQLFICDNFSWYCFSWHFFMQKFNSEILHLQRGESNNWFVIIFLNISFFGIFFHAKFNSEILHLQRSESN